jgi:hypothetical protein
MTKRSRRIPAASLFLEQASGPRRDRKTEDQMSIAEVIEDDGEREPLPIRVRPASLRDHDELCSLFDQLDELHRRARPDMFQPFPPPARTREQVAQWLAQPESTVLVAQSDEGVVGLAVLLTRTPSGFAGAVPRKVVEVDNLVVRADQRGRAARRMSRSRCTTSTATPDASMRASASPHRSIAWCWRLEMLLIGVNRSPYTRRVAISLTAYGVVYEQKAISGFGDREEVRAANPLGRIPALVLDTGETLVDSGAIVDHLDDAYGRDQPLTPAAGRDRREVLKVAAIMMGACDKALQAAYHRNHTPVEKRHQP